MYNYTAVLGHCPFEQKQNSDQSFDELDNKKNYIARIPKSCSKNISSVVNVLSCFLLKYVNITTVTTATVTTVTITTVTI